MAAARNFLQMRRVLSVLARNNKPSISFPNKESSQQFCPCASSIFTRRDFYIREFQTQTDPPSQANKNSEKHETSCSKPECHSADTPSVVKSDDDSTPKHSVISNLKTSPRHDLAMIFTCKVCETRSFKTVCRESYERGVVVARCDGCNNLHLIADRLGWFGEPGSVEDLLAARGEDVKKGSADALNLTLEDLAGQKIVKE